MDERFDIVKFLNCKFPQRAFCPESISKNPNNNPIGLWSLPKNTEQVNLGEYVYVVDTDHCSDKDEWILV